MKKLKVLNGFTDGEGADATEFKVDMILNVDDATAKEWIDAGNCKEHDPKKEAADAAEAKRLADEAEAAEIARTKKVMVEVLDGLAKPGDDGTKSVHIEFSGESELSKSGTGGFDSTAHFLSDVVKACKPGATPSAKLAAWQEASKTGPTGSIMEEGDDDQGGYLVPPDTAAMWMPPALEAGISTPRAFKIPIRGNRINVPALVDATHAGSYFGGVVIYRPGETHIKTPSKPHLRQIQLTLHKMTAIVPVSDELVEDSPVSMAAFLNNVVPQAISFQRDADHIDGTGANMALGAINAANPSLIAVAAEPLQPVATIVFENIVNMFSRFKMVNPGSCTWVAGYDTLPQLATMAMAVGTGGVPVWMPAGGISGAPYSTLFGIPVMLTEKCNLLGTQGDIGLIDWSQYYFADKGGVQAAQSVHLWFDYDITAFRFVLRNDGQPAWQAPLTPLSGGPTLSPFVVLATRP